MNCHFFCMDPYFVVFFFDEKKKEKALFTKIEVVYY